MAGITDGDGTEPGPGQQQPGQAPAGQSRRDPRLGLVIARVFGIPVYISPYWFFVAALLVYLYANSLDRDVSPTSVRYGVSAAFVVLLYVSVLIHELAHCAVARGFKLPVRRVLLYPLGGFSEIEKEPPTPSQEFLVSVAGPAISLALAGVALGLTRVITDGMPNVLIDQLFRANLLVGIFNLLPGLPLDGGRIFRAGIWKITGKGATATIAAAWAGRVLAVALIVVPFAMTGGQLGSLVGSSYFLWLAFIAAFMWLQSGQAIKAARVRERLPGLQARTLARRAIPIPPSLPLSEAIRRADEAQARALVVVDHQATPIAIVNEEAVIATPQQRRPWIEVGTLARTLDPGMVLSADLSGMDLIEAVRRRPATEYLLIEPSGQVYGVLATADLDHAFAGA
ncbi:MAG TPA: site-2 protease family protein [Streptosporangiaceae bacterium]|nr:site-2 protease family protein [Streptosporangiaceae bacterium]